MKKQAIYAVTGQMGTGKSYLCQSLVILAQDLKLALKYFTTDQYRAELLECDLSQQAQSVRSQIIDFFGTEVLRADGFINRGRLADIVYWENDAYQFYSKLMAIAYSAKIQQLQAEANTVLLVEWASIIEDQQLAVCDFNVILTDCSIEIQKKRLSKGDFIWDDCNQRLKQQFSYEERKKIILDLQTSNQKGALIEIDSTHGYTKSDLLNLMERLIDSKFSQELRL